MSKFEESNFYKALQDFFINADKKTFLQFLAEFYNRTEGIIDKNNIQDDLIKDLRELYLEFNEKGIDVNIVREKVNYFLENSLKIKDILTKLNINTNKIEDNTEKLNRNTSNIENISSQLENKANLNEVVTKGNVDLNEMTERTLQAIQGGEGTSFDLLSVPRDQSVNITKLDENIKNTLYNTTIFDDSQIERKGTVGGNDLYIINNNFKDCLINSITLSCLNFGSGEVRIYEKNANIVSLVKTINFDTRVIGSNNPKIDINCKVNNGYIGFTKSDGSIDFGTKNNFGFLNCSGKKSETSFNITTAELFDNFSMKVLIETNKINIVTKEEVNNINNSYITVDKNGNGDYTTIQEAINNYNGIPIFVRNGIYEEGRLECADKDITIIGEDKYRTIIKNKNGLYEQDCLYCSNGVFSNLQFISEYVNGESTEIGQQNGAYAVHVDSNNQANGTCVFNDCIIISDFNAAVGAGLRKNNTVEFNNCDLISRQYNRGQEFANGGMGALFVHNNHTGTGDNCPNQIIRLNNCRLKSKLKNVIRLQEISKNNAEAILDINNCLIYSETNGVTGVIKYGNVNSFDEMSIWRLSDTSYGNTVKELNKF